MTNEATNFNGVSSANGDIKTRDSQLVVELIKDHISNNEKKQAQIRMSVSKTYPSSRVGNSLNGSIYQLRDFNFSDGEPFQENRVAWIDVPVGSTVESVQRDLANFPNARIYKILSLQPILTQEQVIAMEQGISKYIDTNGVERPVDMNYYRDKQRVPNQDTGEWADYKGVAQYRQTAFSATGQADVDTREEEYKALNLEHGNFTLDEAMTHSEIEKAVQEF